MNLGIVTIGGGTTQSIDIIRRPKAGESANITAERYYAQASLKILLSDDPGDIMGLPCIDNSKQPFNLQDLAWPVALWATANATTLRANMTAAGANYTPLPLAWSGARTASTYATGYQAADGYWLPYKQPIIKGYIKIEEQFPTVILVELGETSRWKSSDSATLERTSILRLPAHGPVQARWDRLSTHLFPFPAPLDRSLWSPRYLLINLAKSRIPMPLFVSSACETILPMGRLHSLVAAR